MKKKVAQSIRQIIIYSPPAGIVGAAALNASSFQRQLLMALLLIWANAFFLYRSWANQ